MSAPSIDTERTLSEGSVEEDEMPGNVGRGAVLDVTMGDVTSTAVECGRGASSIMLDGFVEDIDVVKGRDAFGGGEREREIFKRALVKQVVYAEGDFVLREGETWTEEERAGGYFVYFVIRGACAATRLVHPRYPRAHTPEAMAFIDDPMSILRPITTQVTHLNNDSASASKSVRQRASDLKRADELAEVGVANFVRGSYFGEYEVLRGRIPRRCSVRALVNNTALGVMPAEIFEKICRPGTKFRERVEAEISMFI